MAVAGHSGTPLARKLGSGAGAGVVVVHAPDGYGDWLAPLPPGVRFEQGVSQATDVVHVFVDRSAELESLLGTLRDAIGPAAAVWVSWPRKASKVPPPSLRTRSTRSRCRSGSST